MFNKRVRYVNTSLSKQFFLFMVLIYIVLRLTLVLQIVFYGITKYSNQMNIPLTLILMFALLLLLIFLIIGHRFFSIEYDENQIVYKKFNKIAGSINIDEISRAIFDKKNIKFFKNSEADPENPSLTIPLFKFGKVQAIEMNNFYNFIKSIDGITIEKRFKVLPGYDKKQKYISALYIFLAVCVFINYATPIKAIVVLLQAH